MIQTLTRRLKYYQPKLSVSQVEKITQELVDNLKEGSVFLCDTRRNYLQEMKILY